MKRLLTAMVLAVAMLLPAVVPAAARDHRCADALRWPSFTEVARTARSIYVVTVTGSTDGIAEKARAGGVMRGSAPSTIRFERLQPGRRSPDCLAPIGPYAEVGDRLIIAYDGKAKGRIGRVDGVAFVGPMQDRRNVSGLEQLTPRQARRYDAPMEGRAPTPRRAPQRDTYPRRVAYQVVLRPVQDSARAIRREVSAAVAPVVPEPPVIDYPGVTLAEDALWSCGGSEPGFPRSAFVAPADALAQEGPVFDGLRAALKARRAIAVMDRRELRPDGWPWSLAYRDDDRAVFLGTNPRRPRSRSVIYLERDGSEWRYAGFAECRPRPLVLDAYGRAVWRIAPGDPPQPHSTTIPIEILEQACASGRPAAGRVEGPAVTYGDDFITVDVRVRPVGGTCPGNPWTPYVLELDEPIAGRPLYDGYPWPPEQRWPLPPEDR